MIRVEQLTGLKVMETGFIGLGAMGYSMAANLHGAGLLAGVYNRTAKTAQRFADEFETMVAAQPADLAAHCEALVVCVSADDDLLAVVDAIAGALTDQHMVIDCSTVASDTAIEAAARVGRNGARFLDAPVSGGTEGAEKGTLSMMVGGDLADFERAWPVLRAMGNTITHMGEVGSGQATKAVNQIMCAGINQAVCEALRFGEALDLPMDRVVDVVGAGAAGNWFVNHRGKTMTSGTYEPGFKLALHHKDLLICEAMAAARGGELPLTTLTRQEYEPLMDDGHGDEDISALYRRRKDMFDD